MEELVKGFEYAVKHNLSIKEMEMLLEFIKQPQSTTGLAKLKNAKISTIHAIVSRLKLKNLIEDTNTEGKFKIYRIRH